MMTLIICFVYIGLVLIVAWAFCCALLDYDECDEDDDDFGGMR